MSDDLTLTEKANNLLLLVQDDLREMDAEERDRKLAEWLNAFRETLRAVWEAAARETRKAAVEHMYAAARSQKFPRRDVERLRLIMQSLCLPEPKE